MTNVKPTLPREVASAIESLREEKVSNYGIMRISHGAIFESPALILKRYAFEGEHGGTPDLLMSALINGYEVEQSPEDKLREYYDKCRENWMKQYDAKEYGQSEYLNGQAVGVSTTLHILGITIEGINA